MKYRFPILPATLIAAAAVFVTACKENDPKPPATEESSRTLLVYAIASNNLYHNFQTDSIEMLDGVRNIDYDGMNLVLYWVTPRGDAVLKRIDKVDKENVAFTELKRYDRKTYSTDPKRISEVIADVKRLCPADGYDMVMCSHGTGWTPTFKNHGVSKVSPARVMQHSFGADKYDGYTDEIDIDELAAAIPDHCFGYIWFDACYMSGIEVIYQLRNKSDYFVGYPTEVWSDGMSYDKMLRHMLKKEPDLRAAADEFFNSYNEYGNPVTIVVTDNSRIEPFADVCREVFSATSDYAIDERSLQNYSRSPHGPFYELKDYFYAKAYPLNLNPAVFEKALADFLVTSHCSTYDFMGHTIDKNFYTGLSCHAYDPQDDGKEENYYRKLDWFGRVYSK